MAEYQKEGLKTKLNTDLANNSDGAITAEDVRGNMLNIVDSVHIIMASGENYFINDLELRDNSVTTADTSLGGIKGQWNNYDVGAIRFITGSDTTNKDDGSIAFYTSPSGASTSPASPGLTKRMTIENDGRVRIFASGVNPGMEIDSVVGSGVNVLIKGTKKSIAYRSGNGFNVGIFDSRNDNFHSKFSINSQDHIGFRKYPTRKVQR